MCASKALKTVRVKWDRTRVRLVVFEVTKSHFPFATVLFPFRNPQCGLAQANPSKLNPFLTTKIIALAFLIHCVFQLTVKESKIWTNIYPWELDKSAERGLERLLKMLSGVKGWSCPQHRMLGPLQTKQDPETVSLSQHEVELTEGIR